jgi:magnesium transporter
MRVFHIQGSHIAESGQLPTTPPAGGFVWIACARDEFKDQLAAVQAALTLLSGTALVDLHVSDLLNRQLPSHYDYTSQYDLLVFRRLASGAGEHRPGETGRERHGPPVLHRIDTSAVGFAVFDQVLLTVHPEDCSVRDAFATRLLQGAAEPREGGVQRQPTSSPDLMLRLVNQMVDGYLELRRELTRQIDHWQSELLHPRARFQAWATLLDVRLGLHHLDEICEDQRAAVQDWIDALEAWPPSATPSEQRERDLLAVRSRDVLEHIERVVHHVRRLEHSAETAVQMHFSIQGNRANDIMRTLTALTAIFLPLNLIAGIFGMNFEFVPLLHSQLGFWWAMAAMGGIAVLLGLLFWRKRYLVSRSGR